MLLRDQNCLSHGTDRLHFLATLGESENQFPLTRAVVDRRGIQEQHPVRLPINSKECTILWTNALWLVSVLYGHGGTKHKVTGGFMDCFQPACLRDGVVWGADTKLYDQMAAACVLTTVAEVMWHRGVDLYAHQRMAMKKSYDAALESARDGENSKLSTLHGIDAYQCVFRRYQEPRYLSVVKKLKLGFTLAIGEHLPSLPLAKATVK